MSIHAPPDDAEPIYRWYKRAQVDYVEHYIRLYIAYNAWYREVTGTINDRQALAVLKKRAIIWDDYMHGKTMGHLTVYMQRLVDLTLAEPLGASRYWSGSIENITDWQSLIEFWYQVRCMLVHGSAVKARYVWLAFETLDVFMGEIINRMQTAFQAHVAPLGGFDAVIEASDSTKHEELRRKLHARYFTSPNLWQVDMERVEE